MKHEYLPTLPLGATFILFLISIFFRRCVRRLLFILFIFRFFRGRVLLLLLLQLARRYTVRVGPLRTLLPRGGDARQRALVASARVALPGSVEGVLLVVPVQAGAARGGEKKMQIAFYWEYGSVKVSNLYKVKITKSHATGGTASSLVKKFVREAQ